MDDGDDWGTHFLSVLFIYISIKEYVIQVNFLRKVYVKDL